MVKSISIFKDIVIEQKIIYDEIYSLSLKKQKAIERGDTGELEYIVDAEELLVMTLGRLEKERERIIFDTAEENGILQEDLTIKNWPKASENEKAELLSIQNGFMDTLSRLDTINQTNQKLISIQLEYIRNVLENTGEKIKNNSYSCTGVINTKSMQEAKIVDIRM